MAQLERMHLDIVRAVDQHGSLTAAAQQLHLTQSALSHAVRKLEDQLGVALWIREGRRLRPTQAGDYLLSVAKRLLPQLAHAEARLRQFAQGERGILCIGIECHPCHQWLPELVSRYLAAWPDVDVDVRQEFQFGGIGALFAHEIDLLVTPDPLDQTGLLFEPVFDYEQVLAVGPRHPLRAAPFVLPRQLARETLITYPVAIDRLDIYTRFLLPAGVRPQRHKPIETTDILLRMVASGRGVAALPRWLVEEAAESLELTAVRLGESGIAKQIFFGIRAPDAETDYLRAFIALARAHRHHRDSSL